MARNFVKVMKRKSKREAKMMISATFPRPLDRRPSNSKQTACVTVTKSHLQFAVLQLPRCLRLSAVLFLFSFQLVSLSLSLSCCLAASCRCCASSRRRQQLEQQSSGLESRERWKEAREEAGWRKITY